VFSLKVFDKKPTKYTPVYTGKSQNFGKFCSFRGSQGGWLICGS